MAPCRPPLVTQRSAPFRRLRTGRSTKICREAIVASSRSRGRLLASPDSSSARYCLAVASDCFDRCPCASAGAAVAAAGVARATGSATADGRFRFRSAASCASCASTSCASTCASSAAQSTSPAAQSRSASPILQPPSNGVSGSSSGASISCSHGRRRSRRGILPPRPLVTLVIECRSGSRWHAHAVHSRRNSAPGPARAADCREPGLAVANVAVQLRVHFVRSSHG